MLKILCVTPSYWPAINFGGPIYSVHALNKELANQMIDITVFSTNIGIEGIVPINKEVILDGVKITYFPYFKQLDFLSNTGWQFSPSLLSTLRKFLRKFDLVYIVAIWNFPVSAAAYYCRKYNIPYIISPRGTIYPETLRNKAWKKKIYYHFISKRDLRNANAIHFTTNDEAEKCNALLGLSNKSIIIPNGIELSPYQQIPPSDSLIKEYPHLRNKIIILFLGRLNWKKGLDILIRAYSILWRERKDIHLLLAGNDENGFINLLKDLIKKEKMKYVDLSLSSERRNIDEDVTITFTGLLRDKKKMMAYSGSSIFVLPSYSENFGMSVVESMAAGTPVLISNQVGIHKEMEEKKAGYIAQATVESIYRGLKEMINSDSCRLRFSINGKKMVSDYYNIEKVSTDMIDAFEMVKKSA